MSGPSPRRRLGLAVVSAIALSATVTTAPAAARSQDPIAGFTAASAAQQHA